jgi:hypothetical protein
MKDLVYKFEAFGQIIEKSVNLGEIFNDLKAKNPAEFVGTFLELMKVISFKDIDLLPFQSAIFKHGLRELNLMLTLNSAEVSIKFLHWCIEKKADNDAFDLTDKELFKKYLYEIDK